MGSLNGAAVPGGCGVRLSPERQTQSATWLCRALIERNGKRLARRGMPVAFRGDGPSTRAIGRLLVEPIDEQVKTSL